jgi:MSHA pilin protein MshC
MGSYGLRDTGMKKSAGFTLIELITVMVIVGILAVFAAPRMFDANAFKSRGFADQLLATLHYAQKIAIAQRRNVCVAMAVSTVTLTIANASGAASPCVSNMPLPAGGNSITAPTGITLIYSSPSFNFDALGRSTAQSISISGATNAIIVEAETGYVHSP